MPSSGICPKCGAPVADTAVAGLCRKCLLLRLVGGLASHGDQPNAESPPGPDSTTSSLGAFGDYELLAEIARGGMGVFYKARLTTLNRIVALKMIQAGRLASEAEVKRFRLETEAAAHLEHPNIVPIYEVGEHEGRLYFTMKFVEGSNLAQQIRHHTSRVTHPEIATLIATIAHAVHYAHQRGILHRDLKPANILIDAGGEPHITDFGLAKQTGVESDLTLSGAVLCTPNYMAPEQAAGKNNQITTAADVYSLGAILYEMLAGRPPFQADTPLETMRKVVEEEPVSPSRVVGVQASACSPSGRRPDKLKLGLQPDRDLETICLKCLQKSPAQRFASAEALAEDLERWLRREPIRARPSSVWEQGVKWAKRHPARAGLLALAVMAPALIIAILLVSGANVRRERNNARERSYAADIYAAGKALAVPDLAQARQLLNEQRPGRDATSHSASRDLRGFEWRMLWQQSRGQEAFVFTNRAGPANVLRFAPDGRTLLAGGGDGIEMWDIETRQPLGLFPGPDPGPPPGDREPTLEELRPLLETSPAVAEHLKKQPAIFSYLDAYGHTGRTRNVTSLSFTPDSLHLLVGSHDFVRSWNFATRAFDFAVPESVASATTPAAGHIFVVGNNQELWPGDDRQSAHPQSALVYDLAQRRLVAELPGFGWRVALSPDGRLVAAANRKNEVVLWHPTTGASEKLSQPEQWFDGLLAFSPDSRRLLIGAGAGQPKRLWDVAAKRVVAYLHNPDLPVSAVAWSPDSQWLAGGGEKQNIGLWRVPAEGELAVATAGPRFIANDATLHGHESRITALAFSPDGRWLASSANDRTIRFWNLAPVGDTVSRATRDNRPRSQLEFALELETGHVIGRENGVLTIWDAAHGYAPRSLPGTEQHFHAGWLARGTGLVTVEIATNGTAVGYQLRKLPDGEVQRSGKFGPTPAEFQPIATSGKPNAACDPACRWLAVAQEGQDRRRHLHVFDLGTGKFLARLPATGPAMVAGLWCSPDARWLVRLDYEGGEKRIATYDTRTWRRQYETRYRGGGEAANWGALDPQSRFLATAGDSENSLRIWELATGRLVAHCNAKTGSYYMAWSRDGRTLALQSSSQLRLWSMVVYRELAAFPISDSPLGFTAGDRTLLMLTGNLQLQELSPPTLEAAAQPR